MSTSRNLPPELIDLIFKELVESCTASEVADDWEHRHPSGFWQREPTHRIKAFGNACSSFRQRAHSFMWDRVIVKDGNVPSESWMLYRYLRCVDAQALSKTREFTWDANLRLPQGVRKGAITSDNVLVGGHEPALKGLPRREDGQLSDLAIEMRCLSLSLAMLAKLWARS